MPAHAGVLPIGDAGRPRHVEGDAARGLPHRERHARGGVGDVFAEHEHRIRLLDGAERGHAEAAIAEYLQGGAQRLVLVVRHADAEVLRAHKPLQREVRLNGRARRADAHNLLVARGQDGLRRVQRRVLPARLEHAVCAAHTGLANAPLVIHEVRAEAPPVAQEVSVHFAVVAVVDALEHTVAFRRKGVAAHRAVRTNGRGGLQVPLAGVDLGERLVREHAGGAHLHQIAGELALQHAVLLAPEEHARARAERLQIFAAGVVPVVANAAVAGDAAVHLVAEERAEVLIAPRALLASVAAHGVAGHHGHVLQVALAAFLAHRAVVRVVLHQPLDHLFAEVRRERRLDGNAHPVRLHRQRASHLQAPALIRLVRVFDNGAQPAGADRPQRGVPAEVGQLQMLGETSVQQVLPRLELVVLAVDVDARHRSNPAVGPNAPVPQAPRHATRSRY